MLKRLNLVLFACGLLLASLGAVEVSAVSVSVGSQTILPGGNVSLPVTVSGFGNVTSLQFSLQWNAALLQFDSTGDHGLPGLSAGSFGTGSVGQGKVGFSWEPSDGNPFSLADGSTIFTLRLKAVGANGASSSVSFGNSPTLTEVSVNFVAGSPSTSGGSVSIFKPKPTITWATPPAVTYGTALSGTQLNATASVPGSFAYSPDVGVVPDAGSRTLSVTFTPTDSVNFDTASATVTLEVGKATPVLAWGSPDPISYGTLLSATQLNANTAVAGTYDYTPPAGTKLGAGDRTLSVLFTPSDLGNHNTASASVSLTVLKAVPAVSWPTPAPVTYGTALGGSQLNATSDVPGTTSYTPVAGTVLDAGSRTLTVDFTPSDSDNFTSASASVILQVNKGAPAISWLSPSAVPYGTALGGAQLNATADVPGSFAYDPPAGSVLNAGTRTLSVVFTPSDALNYSSANTSVSLVVDKATTTIVWSNPPDLTYGTLLGGAQLNAIASVSGTYTYTPGVGTLLNVGDAQSLSVTFTPADTANYNGASASVTIKVVKSTPSITWPSLDGIVFGTPLSGAQLNAVASVPGTYEYSPALGTVLNAGSQKLTVNFTPTDTANHTSASAEVTLVVSKALPVITWPNPASMSYGAALGPSQLNAIADVAGAFSYNPAVGTVLDAGARALQVSFTPTDSANYLLASGSVTLTVNPSTPAITWASPVAITYGAALGGAQLNASAGVPGAFAYDPPGGTLLNAGSHALNASFVPADSVNYNPASASVTLVVQKATPSITWSNPPDIRYGTTLGAAQLNATASTAGSFSYTPPAGTQLAVGSGQALQVVFTPADSANFNGASASASINVLKAIPAIDWPTPTPITYGVALGGAQLNASVGVAGTLEYSPALGTVLNAGTRTLAVTFTPTDSTSYTTASASVELTVQKAVPPISWATPSAITYGTALGGSQLNASSLVPGTFSYTPSSGTVLNAGDRTLLVSFSPNDTANYLPGSGSVSLRVDPITPVIHWTAPAAITYGMALGGAQLNATADIPGTFSYTPSAGSAPSAGSQTLTATFTPADGVNYSTTVASVGLQVLKATPSVNWPNPSDISYGTSLGAAQLNATASVPGSFSYSPGHGALLNVGGAQLLTVTFTPADILNYSGVVATARINVLKPAPAITWATPTEIAFGTSLGSAQLNATAPVPGAFSYEPPAATILNAGEHLLKATFTPADPANYSPSIAFVTLVVRKATPVVTWPDPPAVDYGTALGAAQLNATADVPGRFSYTPTLGTVLNAGDRTLLATFQPDDSANYTTGSGSCNLRVNQLTPVVSWSAPAGIVYGALLSPTQLNATASVPGTFSYAPPVGSAPSAGRQTLTATFAPSDSGNYRTATASVILDVAKATPGLAWAAPAPIVYGTLLGSGHLNAVATVPGKLSYTPAAGALLTAGSQALRVDFVPTDGANYTSTSASVTLLVNKASPVIDWPALGAITYGTPLGAAQLNATASVPGAFAYAPAAGTLLAAGTRTLTANFTPGDLSNYAPVTRTTSLRVDKALLTFIAGRVSRAVGTPNPEFQFTVAGFVTVDHAGSFTGSPALSTTATISSPAGDYPIVVAAGSLASDNYDFAFIDGLLTVTNAALARSGVAVDGYIAGAVVFFDSNHNGALDPGEPNTLTDTSGFYTNLVVDLPTYDLDKNGRIDASEGRIVVVGGTDLATGFGQQVPLSAPAGFQVVSPVTTLVAELARGAPNLSANDAASTVLNSLGLADTTNLATLDPFQSINVPGSLALASAGIQVHSLLVEVAAVVEGRKPGTPASSTAGVVLQSLATRMRGDPGSTLNLADPILVRNLILGAQSAAGLDPNTPGNLAVVTNAAAIIAGANQRMNNVVGTNGSLSDLVKVQIVAEGKITKDLRLVGGGVLDPVQALVNNSGQALDALVRGAPVGDLTGNSSGISLVRTPTGLSLNWPSRSTRLEEADSIDGPWRAVPATASPPHEVTFGGNVKFFRLR